MSDRVIIKDLLVRGIIGIEEWEKTEKQEILINVVLFTDTRAAGESDAIEDCVNYRTVVQNVIDIVESGAHATVEALAARLARLCLEEPRVARVRVRVEKPGALRSARSVGVEIERDQSDFG